jgi:hypothetical protein
MSKPCKVCGKQADVMSDLCGDCQGQPPDQAGADAIVPEPEGKAIREVVSQALFAIGGLSGLVAFVGYLVGGASDITNAFGAIAVLVIGIGGGLSPGFAGKSGG